MYFWNHHKVLLIGASGCGKTTLALEQYLPTADRLMIVNTNYEFTNKLPSTRKLSKWSPELPVYNPKSYNIKELDRIVRRVRCYQNVLFYLDDLDAFTGGSHICGEELKALMVNGRHQNIGVLISNKRIIGINKLILQQAHYLHLWNVSVRDSEVLQEWGEGLGYQGNILDMCKLSTHTHALFTPSDSENENATDPKVFSGFFE